MGSSTLSFVYWRNCFLRNIVGCLEFYSLRLSHFPYSSLLFGLLPTCHCIFTRHLSECPKWLKNTPIQKGKGQKILGKVGTVFPAAHAGTWSRCSASLPWTSLIIIPCSAQHPELYGSTPISVRREGEAGHMEGVWVMPIFLEITSPTASARKA